MSEATTGVTGNAQELLGWIGGLLSFDPEPTYRVISVDAAACTQTIEHCQTKNTYAVTVTQLTGVE